MDGVITFYSSQQVVRAEKELQRNHYKVILIPGPREISSNCGVALCFEFKKKKEVDFILSKSGIIFEKIHYYPEAKKISKWVD